ncbi:Peptidyl-prolyl cis-trans isomerase surA [Candidatus Ornithobacterium hominis]|uniref:Peptidyl-prolyl cis-trans isomerase surA n=1 Tax=Candidatus Ornithobacterium hominis TaxID=2497989 RepID=A0A383TVF7_9FLAO|nr:peptidylprolyl isomerase [Candidatus Ornithobacterium hominis]MCT7904842.1 peptidylprolyl isomerase [Candidatus Ornithobacterium hominis]SZD71614.1 Peptidyl-prolyl cis-trans isomerase surA [Candidatus Ornithobacterium hominis]SZD72225.1 Peptidyl-prolyl cis-trans isomerase surA [Candidatus Ornithobacterium hominis]
MTKLKLNNFLLLFSLLFYSVLQAQNINYGTKVDGVSAVIGDEIVIQSEIDRDFEMAKQQGAKIDDKCSFIENFLVQKLILSKAKIDTLISVSNERAAAEADARIANIRSRGSDEQILQAYGFANMAEFRNYVIELQKENTLVAEKQRSIVKDVDASPKEVREFFEQHKNELPDIGEQIEISQIIIYPELTENHKQEIKDRLIKIKKDIEDGDDFKTKASLYSDDPGSASNGGLYENVSRGKFVPEFDAIAFNLQEGEISEPVETEFGFHIIKLDKRLGQNINVRHILIKPVYTQDELNTAKDSLNRIKKEIQSGKITFEEAARRYSKDKFTRFNGGKIINPSTQESRFERSDLPTTQLYAIAGLNKGDFSDIFELEHDRKKALGLIRVDDIIPAHKIDIKTDYSRLSNITKQQLQQEKLYQWVREKLPETYIKLNRDLMNCNFDFNWKKL